MLLVWLSSLALVLTLGQNLVSSYIGVDIGAISVGANGRASVGVW